MQPVPATPRRVLAVVAHPYDIEFMAGGLIARWARDGAEFHYCLLTDGNGGSRDPSQTPEMLAALRREEQRAAGAIFGVSGYTFLGHYDGRLVASIELRLQIARVIRQFRPDAVLTSDPSFFYSFNYLNHPDHRAAGEATFAAIMPTANTRLSAPELIVEGLEPHDVREVYLAIPATPTLYVPLSEEDMADKVTAMRTHVSQIRQFPGFENFIHQFARMAAQQATAAGVPCELAEAYAYVNLRREAPPQE